MKKLCVFVYSLGGGGAEKAALELVKGLCDKYEIKLLLFCDVVKYELPVRMSYDVLDSFDFHANSLLKIIKIPLLAYRYAQFCRQHEIDISLSILTRPNIISIVSRVFGNKAKLVVAEHSTLSRYYENGLVATGLKYLIKSLYPKADALIGVSSGCVQDLVQNFGVKPEKVEVVYNPIDIEQIRKMAMQPCEIAKSEMFTFVTCGRLIKSKNVEMIIRAFALEDMQNTRLLILGEGEERQTLELLCKNLNIADRVVFVGFSTNPYPYLAISDAFVFASRFEALPTVLIEALVCGLPVISTDCPSGPAEILGATSDTFENGVKSAKYGILVEMENVYALGAQMKKIAENKAYYRESFLSLAQERSKDFAKELVLERYGRVLG